MNEVDKLLFVKNNKRRFSLLNVKRLDALSIIDVATLLKEHYSFGMIYDLLKRDWPEVYTLMPQSKSGFIKFMNRNGFSFNLKEYNKRQNWWKLQFRYPAKWTKKELMQEQRRLAQIGQEKTVKIRKKKENYNPKQSLEYWISVSDNVEQAEDAYLIYKCSNSPFSSLFYTKRGYSLKQANSIISQKSAQRGLLGLRKAQTPKTEKMVENWLREAKVDYTPQFVVRLRDDEKIYRKKQYVYDLFIRDLSLVIECHGDYWHANPSIFNEDDLVKFPGRPLIYAKEVWALDAHKKRVARNRNLKYIELWESDIKNGKAKEKVLELLRD